VAELLFLPKKEKKITKENKGSRVSQRLLKQQREKEAARELAGEWRNHKKFLQAVFVCQFFLIYFSLPCLYRGK
jgi:hypothetical protein